MAHRLATTVGAIAAALTLSGSVAVAAGSPGANARFLSAGTSAHSTGTCSDVYGRGWVADALAAMSRGRSVQANTPNASDEPTETEDESAEGTRPQNHGWYVSQAAHDKSTTGADHGKAVSAVARGNAGKP